MSGGDRKHFAREIHKAETAFAHLLEEAAAAHSIADAARAKAYALDSARNTALFIGELDHASPTIAAAIAGGFPLLEVRCDHCKHTEIIDLAFGRAAARSAGCLDAKLPVLQPVPADARQEAAARPHRLAPAS